MESFILSSLREKSEARAGSLPWISCTAMLSGIKPHRTGLLNIDGAVKAVGAKRWN